jgi:hypothetical protein
VSQGRAVQRAARHQQRVARVQRATRTAAPLSPRTPAQNRVRAQRSLGFNPAQGDLHPAQRAAARRVTRAQRHVAARPMPHVPILQNPTRQQAQAAHDLISRAINRQVTGRTGTERQRSRDQIIREIQTDPRQRQIRTASSHYARALERRNSIVIARGSAPTQTDVAASLRRIAGQAARLPGVKPLSSRPVATPSLAGTRAQHLEGLKQAALSYGSKDAGGLGLSRRSHEIRAGRAQTRYARSRNQYKALAAPKSRVVGLGPASINVTPGVTAAGKALGAALAQTSLNVGDIGPRTFAKNTGRDIGLLATGPFTGGYEIAAGTLDAVRGRGTQRLQNLATGVGESVYNTFRHPIRSFHDDPLITALTFLGAEGAIGRVGGALARGAGGTVESAGLRGALARTGSEVRSPVAYSADAARAGLKERRYSRNLIHKAVQVSNDARREPLLHPDGSPVTVVRQGREVPVLAPKGRGMGSTGEISRMGRKQGDFIAARQQAAEYGARDRAGHEFMVGRARGEFKGIKGQHAKDAVAMVAEGTITSERHFLTDLQAYRDMVSGEIARHEGGAQIFHSARELRDAKAQVARIDRMLADKRLHAQIPKIVAAGTEIGRRLVSHEKYAQVLGAMDPVRADRARLIHPAVLHMGAKHLTPEELRAEGRMGETGPSEGRSGHPPAPASPGPPTADELAALAMYRSSRGPAMNALLRNREGNVVSFEAIRKSGVEPKLRKAADDLDSLISKQEPLPRPTAVYRGVDATAEGFEDWSVGSVHHDPGFTSVSHSAERAVYHAGGVKPILVEMDLPKGMKTLAGSVDEQELILPRGTSFRVVKREENAALPGGRRGVRVTMEPVARARPAVSDAALEHGALRDAQGRFLSNRDIEEVLRAKGRDPSTVAYLPPGAIGRSAFHKRFTLSRPTIAGAGHTRTGEQFRRGLTTATAKNVREQGVRLAVTTQKVHGIDRTISEHGLTHPDGRYFTFKEATEYAKRLGEDTGEELIPVRAVPARASAHVDELARGQQSPTSMENLTQRLFNDRLSPDTASGAKNVVLMPASLVNQLARHAQSTHDIVKLFQWLNKPFRAAVLPQFRWLTGNFVEPFVVRLGAVGSGINLPGLAVDLRAASQVVKTGLRSDDPAVKRAAQEMQAQLGMGQFVGGRGASVRRTLEEIPGHDAWGPVVAKFPVVRQGLEMSRTLLKGAMAPANAFFGLNRIIENVANRAAFGHHVRADMRSLQGSWTKSLILGQKAAEEAARGLLNTSTQRRYADQMHELLGKYTGFNPTSRALFQTILPFVPWFLNAARFVFWTLPAHHPVKSAVLQQTAAVTQKDWEEIHRDTPPGNLKYAIPNGKGGWIDIARYTPMGAFTEAVGSGGKDFSAFTGQILPQTSGATKALEGKDPFGRDLSAPPGETPNNVKVAVNSLGEALIPYAATIRRLREGGATGYSTSTALHPKTKPGTKHASALARTFSPLNPTYLRAPTGGGAGAPVDPRAVRRAQRSAARAGGSDAAVERAIRRARRAAGGG